MRPRCLGCRCELPEIPDDDYHAFITAPSRCEPCDEAWRAWMARDDALRAAALSGENTLTDDEERRAVAELIEPTRVDARLRDGLRMVPKGDAARWMSENMNPAKMLHRGRSTHGFMWRTEYKAGLLVVTDETSGLIPWVRVWELANDGPPEQMEMAL